MSRNCIRNKSMSNASRLCTISNLSRLSLEEVKAIRARVEHSKKRVLKSVELLKKYRKCIEQLCLSSKIKTCYKQCRAVHAVADPVDIHDKTTIKSVAVIEASQEDSPVVATHTDLQSAVSPLCTSDVIRDQGFIDYLMKRPCSSASSWLESKYSKQSKEVASFLSTIRLYLSELSTVNQEYSTILTSVRPLKSVLES